MLRRRVIPSILTVMSATAPARSAVTFYHDIAPILTRYCSPCHRPGQAGPFPLLSYDDARRRACGPQKQLRFENQHDTGNRQRCLSFS